MASYIRVGDRMMTMEEYNRSTPEVIANAKANELKNAQKRQDLLDKAQGKKPATQGVTFDVRPKALKKDAEILKSLEEKLSKVEDVPPVVADVVAEVSEPTIQTEEVAKAEAPKNKGGRPRKA